MTQHSSIYQFKTATMFLKNLLHNRYRYWPWRALSFFFLRPIKMNAQMETIKNKKWLLSSVGVSHSASLLLMIVCVPVLIQFSLFLLKLDAVLLFWYAHWPFITIFSHVIYHVIHYKAINQVIIVFKAINIVLILRQRRMARWNFKFCGSIHKKNRGRVITNRSCCSIFWRYLNFYNTLKSFSKDSSKTTTRIGFKERA